MTDQNQAKADALSGIAKNLAKLVVALCVLYDVWGDDWRSWLAAFFNGAAAGLTQSANAVSSTNEDAPAPLRLLGHGCHREAMFETCEGEVRNQSDHPLDGVMAEIRFQDKSGKFVTSESALIDYQPLMPGQTSAFQVMIKSNPMIWHYSMNFRYMFGGALKAVR